MNKQPFYNWRRRLLACVLLIFTFLGVWILVARPEAAGASRPLQAEVKIISPHWPSNIQQWADHIGILAQTHGLDPDFIAAVIDEESNGQVDQVSSAGAVGLMGVMPAGPSGCR